MLTGRYANEVEVWDNACELPSAVPTLAHYLRDVGYHTVLCGKMHFIGPDQMHGFNERITTDIYPSSFAWTADWVTGERYRPTGINMRAVVDSGLCTRNLQIDYDEEVEFAGVQKLHDLARFQEDPFMLWVSFTQPHSPFLTTPDYWNLYDHDDIDMPQVPAFDEADMDPMSRWLHYGHGGDLLDVTDEHILNARHAYYGMCSYIDDKVGKLLGTLKDLELEDDTIIIFTSDHGEMLGERGMWYKQTFYEWSSRIPFIIKVPGQETKKQIPEVVSLVDLVPTMLSYATNGESYDAIAPLHGNPLQDLMADDNKSWDNSVISEYTGEGVIAPCRMIRRDNLKYIYTHGHPDLMYDLSNDPDELTNLVGNPDYAEVAKSLRAELLTDWNPEEINKSCIQSQQERLLIQKVTQGDPNWAYLARPDDGQRYVRNASAVGTKAKARYPFVEPTPFKPTS